MLMILNGGGGCEKNFSSYKLFYDSVNKNKPVLFIGFAIHPDKRIDAYASNVKMLAGLGIFSTRLCDEELLKSETDFSGFGGIFCAGGNTFRLLKILRETGGDKKIIDFLKSGGAYIGSSAGAIIGGADIYPITYMDENAVMLRDTHGLDMIGNGFSTIAHYGSSASEYSNSEWSAAVESLSHDYPHLVALPEGCSIVVREDRTYVYGSDCPVYINGSKIVIADGENLF